MAAPAPPDQPLCSVVIVTWNRLGDLRRLLASVARQTIAGRLETIVVDNASTDGTREWLARECPLPLRLLCYGENRGASTGRNAGIRAARAPYVCFVDSDAELISPDCIEACIAHLEAHPETQAASVPVWRDREHRMAYILGGYATPDGHLDGVQTRARSDEPMFLSTCFAVWRREALLALRGFDPWYFWGMEDLDLGLRAFHAHRRRTGGAGSPFHVVPGREVLHEMSPSGRHHDPAHFESAFRRVERERLYMVLAYGGLAEFLRVMLRAPLRQRRFDAAWEQPLTPRRRFLATIWYPARRLLALPKNLVDIRRDHLTATPEAQEIAGRVKDEG